MASSARIDELKKKFDENPRRYFAPLANEYRKAGDPDQAIAICREFLPQQPGHMSGHIVYGQALFDAQQFEESRTVFDTALTLDPENLIALRTLGDIARNLGDFATARTWYQRVLDADPRNEEAAAALTALSEGPAIPAAEAPPAAAVEAAPEAAPAEPGAEVAEPRPRLSEGLILGATPLDEEAPAGSAEPAPALLEGVVTGSAAALEMPAADAAPSVEAAGSAPPPETPAPPAEELLDIGELGIQTEAPVVPRISTPRTTLSAMGVELDRADDESYLPSLHHDEAAPAEPPAAAEPEPAAPNDPFATETMAELYLSQGHPEEAIRVYRQLIVQRGGDPGLEARIARIEAMTAMTPAMPMEAIPAAPAAELEPAPMPDLEFEVPAAAPAAEAAPAPQPEPEARAPQEVPDLDVSGFSFDMSTPTPTSAPEPIVETAAPPEPEAPVPVAAAVPEAGLEFEPAASEAPAAPAPEPAPAATGPSIRDFLSVFALRLPTPAASPEVPAEEVQPAESVAVVEAEVAESVQVFAAEPEAPTQPAERGGSIDALFGGGGVGTPEESAAATLAGAFGLGAPEPAAPAITGAPARRATEELSLDNVFREPQPAPPGEAAGFSFDQFFSGGTPARGATPVRETPAQSQPPESADADIEQFNSWLEGLKKR
ncbi:MAG: tetratricopeptide repeat protein [Gemmatimonadota bacterium]|nr:tetratricopeptide repeat protein [Gemmatimonadota bacterium]